MNKATRILVVDDEPEVLEVFTLILNSAGYDVLRHQLASTVFNWHAKSAPIWSCWMSCCLTSTEWRSANKSRVTLICGMFLSF